MSSTSSPARGLLGARGVRHVLATTLAVVALCAVIAGLSLSSFTSVSDRLSALTARAFGEVTQSRDTTAEVRWQLQDGRTVLASVEMAGAPPAVGTRTEVAYDPARPEAAIIPGAALLAQGDRAASGVTFTAMIAALVLVVSLWHVVTRRRLTTRPTRNVLVRRVRVQKGLMARTWLETESGPQRWIPVYFDRALVGLPSPTEAKVHGDPRTDRLVAVEVNGTVLYPSGNVADKEPRGVRTDNPAQPGDDIEERTAALSRPLRQLRADAALAVPAPLVGLFWAYLDAGGFPVWLGATLITAAIALWWAAVRGSDPS